jgi:hypothetical protein
MRYVLNKLEYKGRDSRNINGVDPLIVGRASLSS